MAYDFNSLTKQADEATNRDKFYTDFEDVDPSKLHQITELTEWMRTKAKGSDVREVIAQLFERTWLEESKEGNANLEVAKARGQFPVLNDRLNNADRERAANKTETINLQTQVNNLVLGAVGDGNNAEVIQARDTFDTLNERFKQNEFNINVLNNTENEYVQLFRNYDSGFYVDATDGTLKHNAQTGTTKFIDVTNIKDFLYTYVGRVAVHQMAFYDANHTWIAGYTSKVVGEWKIQIPSAAAYAKIAFYLDDISTFYVKGKSKLKTYIDEKSNEVGSLINGGLSDNLLNVSESTNGGFYGAGYNNDALGTWVANASTSQTKFIPLDGYTGIEIEIPAVATGSTHQWVFKNAQGTIFDGGWRQASISAEKVKVQISIPDDAVSFSCAYLTNSPISVFFSKKGLTDRVSEVETKLQSSLKGKKIGFIGDSINTFSGYIPNGYAAFYPRGNVASVNQTWWKKLIDATGMELCVNCSWSGSTVSGDTDSTTNAFSGASEKRVNDLTKSNGDIPDIIIVAISINDFGKLNGIVTGTKTGNEAITQSGTINSISDAYVLLIKKLRVKYPKAKIYCNTILSEQFASEMSQSYANGYPNVNPDDGVTLPTWNKQIREIANNMGCDVINMDKCGINYFNLDLYTIDKLHPNEDGHDLMFLQALKDMQ